MLSPAARTTEFGRLPLYLSEGIDTDAFASHKRHSPRGQVPQKNGQQEECWEKPLFQQC